MLQDMQDTQETESEAIESQRVSASETSQPAQPVKAASLTGALVQRGRDRAPLRSSVPPTPVTMQAEPLPTPTPAPELAPVSDAVPLVFAKPRRKAEPAPDASRWSEVLFVAACCAAFFATFLFVLRF
jgi:hypothetical protein